VLPTSERLLSWLVRAGRNRHALVAARDGEIVAHGMIASLPGGVPELAVVVADHWQQRGVGTRLVAGLLDEARRCGVTEVGFSILADNRPALRLAAQAWPGARPVVDHGVYEFRVPLAARDAA
jgi:GNAT superfamily N-acetyltransferase